MQMCMRQLFCRMKNFYRPQLLLRILLEAQQPRQRGSLTCGNSTADSREKQ